MACQPIGRILIYQNGSQLNNQLSISGGTEKTRVFVAFSNFKEDGLIEGVDYKRYTGRINADHEISKRFKVGVSSLYSNVTDNWGSGSVISEAVNQTPLGLPYDAEGNIIFLPISDGIRSNPLSELVPGKRIDERKINVCFPPSSWTLILSKDLNINSCWDRICKFMTKVFSKDNTPIPGKTEPFCFDLSMLSNSATHWKI